MEGRDDGVGRGEGQRTLLEELGEDDDDDGLADGRLHVELISVNKVPLELKDVRKRGIKLKIQLDPPGKSRVSRTCPVDAYQNDPNNDDQNDDHTTCSFTFEGQEKNEGSVLNSVVLPHTLNDDGRGAVEAGQSLMTLWLVEPKVRESSS